MYASLPSDHVSSLHHHTPIYCYVSRTSLPLNLCRHRPNAPLPGHRPRSMNPVLLRTCIIPPFHSHSTQSYSILSMVPYVLDFSTGSAFTLNSCAVIPPVSLGWLRSLLLWIISFVISHSYLPTPWADWLSQTGSIRMRRGETRVERGDRGCELASHGCPPA